MWLVAIFFLIITTATSFRRDSVESPPSKFANYYYNVYKGSKYDIINNFGSTYLPLRSAVEKILTTRERLQEHFPLRSAVEKRPVPYIAEESKVEGWWNPAPITKQSNQHGKRIFCFVESWSSYRRAPATFTADNIDPFACTHIIYAFASVDRASNLVTPLDREYDIVKGGYRSFVGLKRLNSQLKVLLSVSGRMSKMASTASNRRTFIKSVVKTIAEHGFDGIDLHWRYPGDEDMGGSRQDKENLVLLIEELSGIIEPKGWILTVSVPPSRFRVEDGYHVSKIAPYLNFILLRSYDLHEERDSAANHPSPLLFSPAEDPLSTYFNVDYAVRFWLKRGVHRSQLILGIPFFGRSYTLADPKDWTPGSPIVSFGSEARYTQEPGFMSYYEVCSRISSKKWKRHRDSTGSPYMVFNDQWVGYEDQHSIDLKMDYLKRQNLGGVMVWALDLDDFKGICGNKYPLLNTVRSALDVSSGSFGSSGIGSGVGVTVLSTESNCSGQGYATDENDCSVYYRCMWSMKHTYICPSGLYFDPELNLCNYPYLVSCPLKTLHAPLTPQNFGDDFNYSPSVKFFKPENDGPKVICYFTNWSWYRKGEGKFFPEHIKTDLCTHIIYAFGNLDPNTLKVTTFDPWGDIDNGLYKRVTKLQNGNLDIFLAMGGWTDSNGDKYSKLVSSSTNRRNFITSVIDLLHKWGFSGFSLEWNYPVCWQSDCSKGPIDDKNNLVTLLQELKSAFDKQFPPLKLAVGVSGYKEILDAGYDLQAISNLVEYMSVMSYDYHGAWEGVTGHISPIRGTPDDKIPYYNLESTVKHILGKGVDKKKIVLGVPLYGQTFTLKSSNQYEIGDKVTGPGDAGPFTLQPGMMSYYEICSKIRKDDWRKKSTFNGPYAFSGNQWASFEDQDSINEKAKYVKSMGLGGMMAWTMDLDDFQNTCCQGQFPLLHALNDALGRKVRQDVSGCNRPPTPVTPTPPVTTLAPDAGFVETTTDHEHGHWTEKPTPTTTKPWWTPPSTTTTTTQKPWWETVSTTTTKRPTQSSTTTTQRPWWETSTTRRTTTTRPTTTSEPENIFSTELPSTCITGEYRPVPGNCNAYYRCVLGEFRKEHCAGGLHWNNQAQICDWPQSAKCKAEIYSTTTRPNDWTSTTTKKPNEWWTTERTTTRRPTTTKPTTTNEWWTTRPTTTRQPTRPPTSVSMDEGCISGQYYSKPGECNSFYICVNNVLIEQKCAPGLHWNEASQICDWPFAVQCEQSSYRFNLKVTWKNEGCSKGIFAAYPGSCNKYLQCQWDKYEIHSCAPGLHWNQKQQICDWPSNSNCKDGESEEKPDSKPPAPSPPFGGPETTTMLSTTTKFTTKKPQTTTEWSWTSTTTEEPWPEEPYKHPLSGYYKVVCYFTNWAWYRQGKGKYLPEDIDYDLCTHIVYGFAVLDYSNLVIKAHDSWADYDNHFYQRVVYFRRKGVKVTLAIGGWNDSQGDKYSKLVNNPGARAKFIQHVVEFLLKYKFDGLDLDWEYPKCWQTNCNQGPDSDKAAFGHFVRELRQEFNKHNLLLSAAVSPSKTVIDAGYDLQSMAESLDWIAVMCYDYHGQWDKKTGHLAPMFEHPDDDFYYFNTNYTINYWIDGGVPARKLVLGMPLYGQGFTLANPDNYGLNAPAPGPAQAGEQTRAAGFLAYYEICDRIHNRGWKVVKDPDNRMGPYAYHGNQWVGFDDVDMIRYKSEWVREMGLGGGMVWALDLDDFKNSCGEGKHPLLSTIAKTLADPPSGTEMKPKPTVKPIRPPTRPTLVPPTGKPKPSHKPTKPSASGSKPSKKPKPPTAGFPSPPMSENNEKYKVVCYFTNWAWYRQGTAKYLPSDIDPALCTHIVYGFAVLDTDNLIIKPHDSWADIDNRFYEKVTAFRKNGVKVTVAIGGWNDSAGNKYSRLVNNPQSRAKFIRHVLNFILDNNFDGLDLDWEYPKCWQVDCKKGPDSDKQAFADFVTELREAFDPHKLLLSAAVSPAKSVIDAGYEVKVLSDKLDWIAVMCYDYHGQWDKRTGHVAPMYAHDDDVDVTFNTNYTMHYWVRQGADPKKLVLGLPMYGQSFSLADNKNNGLNAPTYGGGEAGDGTRARGFLSYYEICERVQKRSWKVVEDETGSMGPHAVRGDQWVGYDDAKMIKYKSEFVKNNGFGGAMIWALDLDDFRNICNCEEYALLKTINRVLRDYPSGPLCQLGSGSTADEFDMDHMKPPGDLREGEDETDDEMTPEECPHIKGDREDCTKYYVCQFGKLLRQSCAPGLHFNKKNNMCDWPENAKCSENEEEMEKPITTERPLLPPIDQIAPSTEPSIDISNEIHDRSNMKVICYFTNWAWYRQGTGQYMPSDIDPSLCTHVIYAFAVLDPDRLEIKPHDPWADLDNNFFTQITSLAKRGIKVLLGLGGWNDSLGDKYSRLVNNKQYRANFVQQTIKFLEKYEFQGLDLDWEYPKCWQVDCNKGPESDKEGFANLVKELSREFKPRGWLLSAAVSPSKVVIEQAYNVPVLNQYLDWISLMAYDYHGHWEGKTGHVAPLYYDVEDTYYYFNMNYSVHHWINQGLARQKLIVGMPMYGQSFTLADSSNIELGAPSSGPGTAGQFTRAAGFLAFYEICDIVSSENWTVKRHKEGYMGPVAYKGNQWVGYDDVDDIRRKSKYIKENNLGGGMIWALDLDDFSNKCGCGKYPLLTTINQVLKGRKGYTNNCT